MAEAGQGCRTVVAAYAMLRISPWNNTGILVEIAVRKDWKRTGAGKLLLDRMRNICLERGIRAIIVETQPGNEEALGFYKAMGMRICGYNDRYYTNTPGTPKELAIFYSLDIS